MTAGERWVPTLAFDIAWVAQTYYVMKRGGIFVKSVIPDDEITWRPIGTATDYDEAVRICRALRATLTEHSDEEGTVADG